MGNNWTNGTDPDGEWFGIDDAIAALGGAVYNVITNIGNIHSAANFFEYFGVGLVGGLATYYGGPFVGGAVLGLGNSLTQQGWHNINWAQAGSSALLGGVTSYAGAALGQEIAPLASKALSGIGSPVLRNAAIQGATGAIGGFGIGTGSSLLQGNNIGTALKAGEQNALFGLGAGLTSGTVLGLKESKALGVNPLTGRPINNTSKPDILQPDFSTSTGELTDKKGVSNGVINNSDYEIAVSEWNKIKANLPPGAEILNNGNAFKVRYSDGSIMIGAFYPKNVGGLIQWNIHTYFSSPISNGQLYQLKLRFLPEK